MFLFQSRFRLCIVRFLISTAGCSLNFCVCFNGIGVNGNSCGKVCRIHGQGICRCAALVLRAGFSLSFLYRLTDGCHAAAGFLGLLLRLLLGNGHVTLHHTVSGGA